MFIHCIFDDMENYCYVYIYMYIRLYKLMSMKNKYLMMFDYSMLSDSYLEVTVTVCVLTSPICGSMTH